MLVIQQKQKEKIYFACISHQMLHIDSIFKSFVIKTTNWQCSKQFLEH